ncbi:MAG: AEC family transporter [Oscillibacter sp.]|jgi:predicted permease|nr:AEC family transporter [Oscillibacter sp.]
MLENVMTVGVQALILFALIMVGFVLGKAKLISPPAIIGMTNLTLYVVIPCTLINAFQLELTPNTLRDFLISLAAAVGIHAFNFLTGFVLIRDKDPVRKRVFVLAATFSNCNFMGFPLQTALIGSAGIFYGSSYAMVTPLTIWTGGVLYLDGDSKSFSLKKALLNPGIFGIIAGLLVFFSGVTLVGPVEAVVAHLASMAVPLPMVIIGCQLADMDLRQILRDKTAWLVAGLRLLILPLSEMAILYLLGVRGNVLLATIIAACAPPAAIVAMMAQRSGKEPELASEMVSLQTLLSIVTMPFVVGLTQMLA